MLKFFLFPKNEIAILERRLIFEFDEVDKFKPEISDEDIEGHEKQINETSVNKENMSESKISQILNTTVKLEGQKYPKGGLIPKKYWKLPKIVENPDKSEILGGDQKKIRGEILKNLDLDPEIKNLKKEVEDLKKKL